MTILRQAGEEYLRLRRVLGFKLRNVGPALLRFLAFCENEGAAVVTVDLARRWAMSSNASPARTTWRFQIVRDFAIHHQASDPRTEIPPKGLFQDYYDRRNPYLYSKEEFGRLLQAARELPPGQGLRHRTYATLFSLLAATGLRVGEALALDDADVDWQAGLLVVRQSKFRKSRLVPVHASSLDRLRQYQEERARILSDTKDLSILCFREWPAVTIQDRQWPFPTSVHVAPRPGVFNFPEASHPRFAASICREHPHPLVWRGRRCGTLSPQVEHVSGAWVLCAYLLVSDRRPGIASVGYRASGAERRESCELRPPLPGCSKGSSRID